MIFAVILAGGTGTRIKSSNLPKQFLHIGDKPILCHTVDKFLYCPGIDQVVVAAPEIWMSHTQDILSDTKYADVKLCAGGLTRQESLYRSVKYISEHFGGTDNDIVVSHDVARPFVTTRIISENIKAVLNGEAADTVIRATDTIVKSTDGLQIQSIPDRASLYQGQTPQSFRLKTFMDIYETLDAEYLSHVTDAARILTEHGCIVSLVEGEPFNIKITNDFDLHLAQFLLSNSHD